MRRFIAVMALACSADLGAATFTVTTTADSGAGSLRQAILDADLTAGVDTINFAIGSGPQTITLLSNLPLISEGVIVDGRTQPGFAGTPIVEIGCGGGPLTIFNVGSSGSTFRGLVLNNCGAAFGINGDSNIIEGNYIGVDPSGTTARPFSTTAVYILSGSNNLIGGSTAAARNVIASSFTGVRIDTGTGNTIQGNYIGTNAAGTAALPNTSDAIFISGPSVTISGNVLSGNVGAGIDLNAGSNSVITGNLIGTNAAGTTALANMAGGIVITAATLNTRIGGTTAADRNVISGNGGTGIQTSGTGTLIQGNYIGTNLAGTAALPNASDGIRISSGANNSTIGGAAAGAGNVISGNAQRGIWVPGATDGTVIAGNLIGTNAAGTAALPNQFGNISIDSGPTNTTIGGTVAGARNVISGTPAPFSGISVLGSTTIGTLIAGNYIGTDITGTAAIGNDTGIALSSGAGNTTIGGTTAAARNVISGNGTGILLGGATGAGLVVQGNYIGTDVTGSASLGNTTFGVRLTRTTNMTLGGTVAGAGNVISGTVGGAGVSIDGSPGATTGNVLAGNLIGTNAAGTAAIPNLSGIEIMNGATTNTIGGTAVGARNVISGNATDGIVLNSAANNNTIQGNFIGTDAAGTGNLANGGAAINLLSRQAAVTGTQIGGIAAGAGNRIWFGTTGVAVTSAAGTGNAIRRNSISNHTFLGIDLGPQTVVQPNDPGDSDVGPNNLQNYPVIASAAISGGSTVIGGTLNSTPSTAFDIEFFNNTVCNAKGFGEGLTFLASLTVTTDAMGNAPFSVTIPSVLGSVTSTATDPAGNTSEFSACIQAGATTLSINDVSVTEGNSGTTPATFTVTASPTPTSTVTVDWFTLPGSATSNVDFLSSGGTITFNAGESTKTVTVPVVGDTIDELDETFTVNLTRAVGASISDPIGVGTIVDDDTAVGSISGPGTIFEGAPAVFTVTLSTPSDRTVTISYSTQDVTATAPSDYTATSGTLTFAPLETTKTISVPTIADTTFEPEETFKMNASGSVAMNPGSATVTIRDALLIPTLSTWMLLLLAVVLAVIALATQRP